MSEDTSTLHAILDEEANLITEASLAIPHSFSECTYSRGYIRQPVYLCKTCNATRGICASCSVSCHTDHEQLELFPKRHFRCDCPTRGLDHPCTLVKGDKHDVNTENSYNQNFENGQFCRCGRHYDPNSERETMVQCLSCEDWFHESCLRMRERPSSRPGTPELEPEGATNGHDDVEDDDESISDPTLPPARILSSEYDALICRSCVMSAPILSRWAGTPGVLMLVRQQRKAGETTDPEVPEWRVIGKTGDEYEELVDVALESAGEKRKRESVDDDGTVEQEQKRVKLDGSSASSSLPRPENCLAPRPNPIAQQILAARSMKPLDLGAESLGEGDIFLTEGFRDRWCRCHSCLEELSKLPFLLEEEETYEAPEDPDSGLSLEELGMRALQTMPRDRAIDGIRAFNDLRDDLIVYLRDFAQHGETVKESDIRGFFERKLEENAVASSRTV
ncbi:hypothetical protein SISNIDRAFT_475503 [Sistotremastrum niveocremeum HHB9708]|uniref:UBR-type domain-containing protein n=1 Tax=Sistotremastrum niveocremeum HHB9708 TaxID=1314777 RepID=A0A164R102_9AGAM|nr:hypothetical protein SISNIDRAFT_475503 [Sistotremastrum niveocremeum HHB9708]